MADRDPSADQVGPVQAGVLAMLSECSEGEFATSIAQRSPVGPRAVRVRRTDAPDGSSQSACQELASRLESQPWVDAVAARPPAVYVRVGTDALRSWVGEGSPTRAGTTGEGAGREAVVRVAAPGPTTARSLDAFRELAVGRSLAALLRSRGYEARLATAAQPSEAPGGSEARRATAAQPSEAPGGYEAHLATAAQPSEPPGGSPARSVAVGAAATDSGEEARAPVGGVDVRHGPLRARHGGSVSAEDLLGEISQRAAAPHGLAPDRYADALLAFVLVRTERARRVQLDDAKLRSESEAFDSVLAARALAAAGPAPETIAATGPVDGEPDVRDLAIELDMLPTVAARAAQLLEPALPARFARSVAERAHAAAPSMPPGDPMWPAVREVIDAALELAGIDMTSDEIDVSSQV